MASKIARADGKHGMAGGTFDGEQQHILRQYPRREVR